MNDEKAPLLSSKEVAERLGITERYVAILVGKGEISAQRFGRNAWAIDAQSVDAYEARKAGHPSPEAGANS